MTRKSKPKAWHTQKRTSLVATLTPIREDARNVVSRIRGMRAGAPELHLAEIVAATRAGRR